MCGADVKVIWASEGGKNKKMKELLKPTKLKKGDTIATLSISGGRAGDSDLLWRYELGKKRLVEIFGLHVIESPNALRGSKYLYENPKARAEDIMWALKTPTVKGIFANMGGDDSARLLPYMNFDVIHDNPKILLGYSDITVLNMCFLYANVMSYYGPNVLTPFAQPVRLDSYTEKSIRNTLFSDQIIGEIPSCERYTSIEWQEKKEADIPWHENSGYQLIQGEKTVRGRLIGGTGGSLRQIMGTYVFPKEDVWKDSIVYLDSHSPYNSLLAVLHELRALDAAGVFKHARGLLIPNVSEEYKKMLIKFLKYEVQREDLPVLTNVDFGHRTPMTVFPVGALAEINCEKSTLSILESGVQ